MSRPALVVATWRDAWFDFDRKPFDEPRPDYIVTTAGFLIDEGPAFLSIAHEILPEGDGWRAVTHVPRAVLVDLVTVRKATA